jgi:ribosome-associated protein
MIELPGGTVIPSGEFELSYARSSGPGGQNVNKVNSKAVLRWNLRESPSLDEGLRARLLQKLAPRLTADGELVIASDRYRDQPANREDCFAKLRELLAWAAARPKPRKKPRPTRSSKRQTLEKKRRHSVKKRFRRDGGGRDEY